MNARVKRATAAQEAVADEDGLIVVEVLKKRPIFDDDGKITGWIRRVIVERANKDLEREPEAAAARDEVNEGIKSERTTTAWSTSIDQLCQSGPLPPAFDIPSTGTVKNRARFG